MAEGFGNAIHLCICCLNPVASTVLNLSLIYSPMLFVRVRADLVDSIISVPTDLAAVVLGQALGPMDFFERSQEKAEVAAGHFEPLSSCRDCSQAMAAR